MIDHALIKSIKKRDFRVAEMAAKGVKDAMKMRTVER